MIKLHVLLKYRNIYMCSSTFFDRIRSKFGKNKILKYILYQLAFDKECTLGFYINSYKLYNPRFSIKNNIKKIKI